MLVRCFLCPSSWEMMPQAGVDACPACGAMLVWPACPRLDRSRQSRERAASRLNLGALRYGVMPYTMRKLIVHRQDSDRFYTRTAWNIQQRTPMLCVGAGHGSRARDIGSPPDPRSIDPWAVDPSRVADATRCVATCPACAGAKKVQCSSCRGVGRLTCNYCAGTGLGFGKKGLKNCPSCRGRGNRDCPACTNGLHGCPTCDKTGRVYAWIEIVQQRLSVACVLADFEVERAHARVKQVEDFDAAPAALPTDMIADTGWRAPSDGAWKLPPELVPQLNHRTQRVIGVRAQMLSAPATRFTYSTRFSSGTVELAVSDD